MTLKDTLKDITLSQDLAYLNYKNFEAEVRFMVGRFNDKLTDEEIKVAFDRNYDARDFANQFLLEMAYHYD